ncbi:hypothetical protein HBI56_017740 [Parastagonospora nodorum]|nr:hypothetical protein HBH56_082270 [Parastagonospora nodorum]QRC96640.1 hypothetical protein JI435_434020 [Parastagonospora nodorum SN15]KAH3929660.1 hypothetical protein HBH54_119570 [Parastagonospora nodorum]KAH3955872.1 hypothetical protein HBH53_005000 [Parastagonospora nodorum]KAH3976853.1 hypothetical protein HBH51_076520 [Parastagonospora nodorum]
MINGYIPDPCFDSEMHQDFTTNVELGFWADEAATQPISTAELLEGDMIKHKTAWLSNYAHWQHCMYLINGTHRAYSRMPTLFLDAYLDQPHIQHCFTVIAEPKPTLPYKKMEQPMEAVFISERRCYLRDLSPSVPENPGAVNIAITHAKVLPQLPDFVDEDDNRR